ncbi:hypothetical protein [Vibrio profundi]|uniref:hypothetical protein n=1 Tax=Vibrio profundi TaxID=1774960 RepID=UPI003736120B
MNRRTVCSIIAALLGLFGLIFLIVDSANFAVTHWPQQAFQDIVFSLVMGFGISKYIAYAYAGMVFVTVAVVSYAIGFKVSGLLPDKQTK